MPRQPANEAVSIRQQLNSGSAVVPIWSWQLPYGAGLTLLLTPGHLPTGHRRTLRIGMHCIRIAHLPLVSSPRRRIERTDTKTTLIA